MGRVKTQFVKRVSHELIRDNPQTFTTNYEENKKILEEVIDVPSKKIKNLIAGAVTSLVKQED